MEAENVYFKKNILVTGGTGLIGQPLVQKLLDRGANVRVVSLDDKSRSHEKTDFQQLDLTSFENCMKATEDMDYVFHLAGIKGSPMMTMKKPASFFYPTVSFNTHMLEAARKNKVRSYLFTSSVGVYSPNSLLKEDDVWSTFPSPNDRFAGWAKRMGELQLEAYRIEYGWSQLTCVRPANVYGPFDNFDPQNAMVIPSLINRALSGENPFTVWGDGSAVRDFIFSEDCADGILKVFETNPQEPVNLASGLGVTIKELVETLSDLLPQKLNIVWDATKPSGDKIRLMDTKRAEALGFRAQTDLRTGLSKTIDWYQKNKKNIESRYNVFK
ncbi:MAG: NAD-dependent epimerase/dehydratase family protein [Pseudobdellovibrio sp.]